MRHAIPLAFAVVFVTGCKGTEDDTGGSAWVVPDLDVGPRRADGSASADLSSGATAWFAAEQVVPLLEWKQPGAEIPLELWRQVLRPTVADDGACPSVSVADDTTTWKTYDCRSSQGYEWTGEVSQRRWEEDGWTWDRYDFDLTVTGDTEDVAFDRIALQGALVYINGDDRDLTEAVQVNVAASAEGLLSRADADDPREAVWSDWRVTARYEEVPGGIHHVEGDATLGDLGTVAFASHDLLEVSGCSASPEGTLTLDGAQGTTLGFHGADDCRACADFTVDGAESGEACGTGQ